MGVKDVIREASERLFGDADFHEKYPIVVTDEYMRFYEGDREITFPALVRELEGKACDVY